MTHPLAEKVPSPAMLPDFFKARIRINDPGCWLWTGSISGKGYARAVIGGKQTHIHRWIYEYFYGSIGMLHPDHLCRVRNCVNPTHIEPVTCRENVLRGIGPTAKNAKATHCKNGHQFDITIQRKDGTTVRRCRICTNQRHRESRKRNSQQREASQ